MKLALITEFAFAYCIQVLYEMKYSPKYKALHSRTIGLLADIKNLLLHENHIPNGSVLHVIASPPYITQTSAKI